MAVVRKKQDDKILKTLREIVSVGGNKECFDCGQKGPTYINMTIGSFVCTTCSGILRGLTPPHRVKSISMATFTQEEIDVVRQNGNDNCSRTWLGLWDPKRAIKQEHRDFMVDKYERKRYYLEPASPLKSLPTNTSSSMTSLTGGSASGKFENLVPLKAVTLTPPTTLRLSRTNSSSCNGLNSVHSASSIATGGATQGTKFYQQFTPDDSSFFADPPKILPPTPQKHGNHHHRQNGIVGANGVPTYERSQKNGLLSSSSAGSTAGDVNANKFTPDADFVADFGNANIVNSGSGGSSRYGSTNSLRQNGSANGKLTNGGGYMDATTGLERNGALANGNGGKLLNGGSDFENFADFEHNAIFNAADYYSPNSIDSSTTTSVSSTTSVNSLNNDPFLNYYSPLNATNANTSGHGTTLAGGTAISGDSNCGSGGGGVGGNGFANFSNGQSISYSHMTAEDAQRAQNLGYGYHRGGGGISNHNGGIGYIQLQNYNPTNSIESGSENYSSMYTNPHTNHKNGIYGNSINGSSNSNNNNNNNSNPNRVQWNLWQQLGCYWPATEQLQMQQQQQQQQQQHHLQPQQQLHHHQYNNASLTQLQGAVPATATSHCSNLNRWSLPASIGSLNANNASVNSSMNSTPSVDRYAALKDLDEHFREIKLEKQSEANNNITSNGSNGLPNGMSTNDNNHASTANPFKTANPFQQQSPQQPLGWPIATGPAAAPNGDLRQQQPLAATNGFYATSPYQQNGFLQGHLMNGNFQNGTGGGFAAPAFMSNGNGYAVNSQYPGNVPPSQVTGVPTVHHHFGNFGNPFMAAGTATANSNNPFL